MSLMVLPTTIACCFLGVFAQHAPEPKNPLALKVTPVVKKGFVMGFKLELRNVSKNEIAFAELREGVTVWWSLEADQKVQRKSFIIGEPAYGYGLNSMLKPGKTDSITFGIWDIFHSWYPVGQSKLTFSYSTSRVSRKAGPGANTFAEPILKAISNTIWLTTDATEATKCIAAPKPKS